MNRKSVYPLESKSTINSNDSVNSSLQYIRHDLVFINLFPIKNTKFLVSALCTNKRNLSAIIILYFLVTVVKFIHTKL